MTHIYYSQRKGTNPNLKGLPLSDIIDLFNRVYSQMETDGYFTEAFGFECVDLGYVVGKVRDIELDILLRVRKRDLWPPQKVGGRYTEDDLFDIIEYLFQHVSKPIKGTYHAYGDCGMHWETFDCAKGREEFRTKINGVLRLYQEPFELAASGEVLHKPEAGFEPILEATVPSKDTGIVGRIEAAVLRYRRHGSTIDDRRQAVRDLADVLEYLRPQVKVFLTTADDKDLFNIANNFGIRHHNDKQKTAYDATLWLSWMFYFYLATIHVVLRKIEHDSPK